MRNTIVKKLVAVEIVSAAMFALAETEVVDGITWTYSIADNKAKVSSAMPAFGDITIPSELGGCPVTSIGYDAFDHCTRLRSVTISEGVTDIEQFAFYVCEGLTNVVISSSVSNIGWCAFSDCRGLTRVRIPAGVMSIEEEAFEGCGKMVEFIVDEENPNYKAVDGLLLTKDGTMLVAGVNGEVTIPESVTLIGNGAFSGCSGLTHVTIPSGVMNISEYSFYGCSGLTDVTIPENVTNIGRCAFCECTGFTSMTIPSGVTSIDSYAFSDCTGLTSMVIPSNVASIGHSAFLGCSELTSMTISNGVTSIGQEAFRKCGGLTSLTIPPSMTSLGKDAFYECSELMHIDFEGAPPTGFSDANFNTDARIRYNVAYEEEWLSVLGSCGYVNVEPYDPNYDGPTITGVTAQQRYPWNGKFDISYTVSGVDEECRGLGLGATLKVFAVEQTTHVTNVAEAAYLSGDAKASDGTHHLVWDMDAQGCFQGVVSTNFKVYVAAEVPRVSDDVQLWEGGPYWAQCNVGASKPEEYGYYFSWGDTVGYKRNADDNGWVSVDSGEAFKFTGDNCPTYGRDNSELRSAGYIDSTTNLVAGFDAATAHLGAPWRMPTEAEIKALVEKCTTTWITTNGVKGRLVTGKGEYASRSIFLPAAGHGDKADLNDAGSSCNYWSSTPYSDYYDAWSLNIYSTSFGKRSSYRYYGQSVRPLRAEELSPIVEYTGASPLVLADLRTGEVRETSDTETLTYSTDWVDGAGADAVAVVKVNGTTISEKSGSGTIEWKPTVIGTNTLTHQVLVNGEPVGESMSVQMLKRWKPSSEPSIVDFNDGIYITYCCTSDGGATVVSANVESSSCQNISLDLGSGLDGHPVTSIGEGAFSNLKGLTSVKIPESVTSIGSGAFKGCSELTDVYFEGDTIASIANDAFEGCNWDMVVHVPAGWKGRSATMFGRSIMREGAAVAELINLVTTNVVVQYVLNSIQPEIAVPVSQDTGFVTVITEVKSSGAVSVPSEWKDNYPTFEEKYGTDFGKALTMKSGKKDGAGNEMLVWQDYVAGTDPTDENDRFTASITLVDGAPFISYTPELSAEETAKRIYKTYGKKQLMDAEWTDVTNLDGEGKKSYNFFMVTVEMK